MEEEEKFVITIILRMNIKEQLILIIISIIKYIDFFLFIFIILPDNDAHLFVKQFEEKL